MNESPWRLVAAGLLLGALAGGIVLAMRPSHVTPAAAAAAAPAPTDVPTSAAGTAPSTASSARASAPSSAPSTTARLATTTPPPQQLDPAELRSIAVASLDAWAGAAASGEVDRLAAWVDPAGPQYDIAVGDAQGSEVGGAGVEPYRFQMPEAQIERPRPQRVVLTGSVTMSRPGEPAERFDWNIHLRWSGSKWRLWTIVES